MSNVRRQKEMMDDEEGEDALVSVDKWNAFVHEGRQVCKTVAQCDTMIHAEEMHFSRAVVFGAAICFPGLS